VRDSGEGPMPFPLARGILGHVGLAQHFARLGCAQSGRDPDEFAKPVAAMERAANQIKCHRIYDAFEAALAGIDAHLALMPPEVETMRVRAVEFLIDTTFGGHPYTARIDLVMEDANRGVWAIDHKFVGRIEDKTLTRYAMSGQFLGITHLGQRKWGDQFAGVMLNVCGCRVQKHVRRQIEAAPYALQRFERNVIEAEQEIARMTAENDERAWPLAMHEQVCYSAYGPCDEFDRCRWGR
jgi:hypothetical protein